MTRFARAKGSKASNERVEQEATLWEELKSFVTPNSKKVSYDIEDITGNFNENEEENDTKNKYKVESDSDESNDEKLEDQVKILTKFKMILNLARNNQKGLKVNV